MLAFCLVAHKALENTFVPLFSVHNQTENTSGIGVLLGELVLLSSNAVPH